MCRGLGCCPRGQAKSGFWAVSVHRVKESGLHRGGRAGGSIAKCQQTILEVIIFLQIRKVATITQAVVVRKERGWI